MKIAKILLWIVLFGLILTQLLAIVQRVGNTDSYSSGFIVGKLILIGVFLIIGKIATKAINQRIK